MAERRAARWWELSRAKGKQGDITSEKGHPANVLLCPECGDAPIVFNGNYFCDDWGGECDWALPHPSTRKRDREICDLIGIDYD